MKRYKAYPEYKDSGVDWLGKIPNCWNVGRYKHILTLFQGAAFKSSDYVNDSDVISIRMGNIKKEGVIDLQHNIKYLPTKYKHTYSDYILQENDLILAMTDMSPTLDFLAVPAYMRKLDISKTYLLNQRVGKVIVDSSFNVHYLKYLLLSNELRSQLKAQGLGTVQSNMSNENLYNCFFTVPDLLNQTKIANFLDYEIAKIDLLIEKQQQLIKLLKEKRQAVISYTVTKGLNPNVLMRDSGVEWLGKIPAHWKIKSLKFICNLITLKTTTSHKTVIALENITSWTGKYIKTNSEYNGSGTAFCCGDILFNKLRPYLAKVYAATDNGVAFGDLLVYRPTKNTLSEYCFYQMSSERFISIINSSTYGSKMPRASVDFINDMHFLIPPLHEQKKIVEVLNNKLKILEKVISKSKTAIFLLKERRSALISAAVTGKIDVRDWQPPSPSPTHKTKTEYEV